MIVTQYQNKRMYNILFSSIFYTHFTDSVKDFVNTQKV